MQNKLHGPNKSFEAQNVFDEKRAQFARTQEATRLKEKYRHKAYEERNADLKGLCSVVGYFAQGVSILTASTYAFTFFENLFSGIAASFIFSTIIAFVFLIGLESFLRSQAATLFQAVNQYGFSARQSVNVFLICLAVGASLFFSFNGSYDIANITSQAPQYVPPSLHNIEQLQQDAKKAIAARSIEAEKFKNDSKYSGRIDQPTRRQYLALIAKRDQVESELFADIERKEAANVAAIERAKIEHSEALAAYEQKTTDQGGSLAGVAVVAQLLFFLCLFYSEKFDWEVFKQYQPDPEQDNPAPDQPDPGHDNSMAAAIHQYLQDNPAALNSYRKNEIGFKIGPGSSQSQEPTFLHIDRKTGERKYMSIDQVKRNLAANKSKLKRAAAPDAPNLKEIVNYWENAVKTLTIKNASK